ncbi:hypothetical protein KBX06_14170 [Micromonospora sp. C31]|uniref:hypothetical protein n=1 Tax=Micromonospora sp. C31 TaxID=2824876 RepID=UPI001B3909CE|nr:hypothetical protein [Micromonospora sp. C31]MBQ1074299.1 hypothetical protein [Micromonospora sp. C31]
MFFRRTERPADRGASDRLLDAARTGTPRAPGTDGSEPLSRLLSAAAAPARPDELAGEEAAVAAFRAARAAGPAAGKVPSPRRRRFTAGAVAWGAGIAVTATAGAALAAGALDRADDPPPRPATPAPQTTEPATTGPGQDGPTAATGGGHPTGIPSGPSATGIPPGPSTVPTSDAPGAGTTAGNPPGTPEPRAEHLHGLCRAYLAKQPAQREKALDTPSFAGLVTAAGGREQVEGFCGELVPEAAAEEPPGRSTRKGPTVTPTPGPTAD